MKDNLKAIETVALAMTSKNNANVLSHQLSHRRTVLKVEQRGMHVLSMPPLVRARLQCLLGEPPYLEVHHAPPLPQP